MKSHLIKTELTFLFGFDGVYGFYSGYLSQQEICYTKVNLPLLIICWKKKGYCKILDQFSVIGSIFCDLTSGMEDYILMVLPLFCLLVFQFTALCFLTWCLIYGPQERITYILIERIYNPISQSDSAIDSDGHSSTFSLSS